MENSILSSPHKTHPTPEEDVSVESGWTDILDEYSADNRANCDGDQDEDTLSFISASMVSDAGSGPAWKHENININNCENNNMGGITKMPKGLNFKKKKTQKNNSFYDDSLEDTASSPINSPKITTKFKRMDINSKMMEYNRDNYKGKGIAIDEYGEYNKINEGQEMNDKIGFHLKDIGLCVMPLQMALDYFN